MFESNPFAVAGASLPAGFLQGFLVVMVLLVVAGTLFDIIHKGSARYFFANMRKPKIPNGLYWALTAMTVLNIVIALFWSGRHTY